MIYDIFDSKDNTAKAEPIKLEETFQDVPQDTPIAQRDRLFSSIASRLFFLLLFIADALWAVYSISVFTLATIGYILTLKEVSFFKNLLGTSWISLRRSLACGLSLFIALFSPAFGIMVACTYFLMYDKAGVEEVVPASLQEQFKDFFQK